MKVLSSFCLSCVLFACSNKTESTIDEDQDGYDTTVDCDDNSASIHPNATDMFGDDIDQNCDGTDGVDADGDGIASAESGGLDCDDTNTDAMEVGTFYADEDGDGFGNSAAMMQSCTQPDGYVTNHTDCDDSDAEISPNATEVCDFIDNDCNGIPDDGAIDSNTFYADADNDGFGDATSPLESCLTSERGYVTDNTDCDDNEATTFPGATEYCDTMDNDCNGTPDDNAVDMSTFYADIDADGFGDANNATMSCEMPQGYVVDNTDCDDTTVTTYPGATEYCDTVDNDCNGTPDDNAVDMGTFYADIDADGFGDANNATMSCEMPQGYVADNTDCDDSTVTTYPGATEYCDSIDNDCNGTPDDNAVDMGTFYADTDADGFGDTNNTTMSCETTVAGYVTDNTDCDDSTVTTYPGATEYCDTMDNDCNGTPDDNAVDMGTFYADTDADGFGDANNTTMSCEMPQGYVADNTDCDDATTLVAPNAQDIVADGIDNDCDGMDLCYEDLDQDDFGSMNTVGVAPNGLGVFACTASTFTSANNTDCDDNELTTNPSSFEICDTVDNDCNGMPDDNAVDMGTFYADTDSDGFGDVNNTTMSCETTVAGYVTDNTDCDDNASTTNPDASEICDTVDNNCDTQVDEGVQNTYFVDSDADGFGSLLTEQACVQGPNHATNADDCDDNSATTFPGAAELESITDCMADSDGDGFGDILAQSPIIAGTDCDDSNGAFYPTAVDMVGDALDQNCDILDGEDLDGDGDASLASGGTDCDDNDATKEGLDADNDGTSTCAGDCFDGDNTTIGDDDSDGYFSCVDDCNDGQASINPNALETCLDGIDQDCDGADSTGICDGVLSNDDFTMIGEVLGDRLGQSVSYAGNITGSSTADLVVTSRWNNTENGAVYIFAGGNLSGTTSASNADVIIHGEGGERFGFDVAGGTTLFGGITSDFNGDGNDDLLVGAPQADVLGDGSDRGAAYLFYGPLSGTLNSSDANVIFTAQTQANNVGVDTGTTVAFLGDIDGDGLADIAIGDPTKQNSGASNGEAYLIFGKATDANLGTTQYSGNIDLSSIVWSNSTLGQEINSDGSSREQMGHAIDSIGDVNGDGIDDVMITGYRWDVDTTNSDANQGGVFVWYGGANIRNVLELSVSHTPANSNADIIFIGANAGDQIGRSASGAGDFNGDGLNDIVIGSEHANALGGAAYVVQGNIPGDITLHPANAGVLVEYVGSAGETAGRWVSSAGNLDGDALNTSDILIGAKLADANGVDSGAVYVMMGGPSVTGTRTMGSADAILAGENAADQTGICVSGLDDMDGDGIPEILIGSYQQSTGTGAVQLVFGATFQ